MTTNNSINNTLSSPKISTGIYDVNGNEIIALTATGSAVNYFTITNAATSNAPFVTATGSDSDIGMTVTTKGSGALNLQTGISTVLSLQSAATSVNFLQMTSEPTGVAPILQVSGTDTNIIMSLLGKGTGGVSIGGTSTNDNAATGAVGEFVSSIISSGAPVSAVNATPVDLTSISLTAGDWDVWGNIYMATGNTVSVFAGWLNSASVSLPDTSLFNELSGSSVGTSGFSVPGRRFSLASTTTIYISFQVNFVGGGATDMSGGIYARRAR